MKSKNKFKTISDREMENPDFKKHFEETWPAFQLEVRLLNAMKNRKLPHFTAFGQGCGYFLVTS